MVVVMDSVEHRAMYNLEFVFELDCENQPFIPMTHQSVYLLRGTIVDRTKYCQ